VRLALASNRYSAHDAFRNISQGGASLRKDQLSAGLRETLGVRFDDKVIGRLFRYVDADNSGLVTYANFTDAFAADDLDFEAVPEGGVEQMAERPSTKKSPTLFLTIAPTMQYVGRFEMEVIEHTQFECVWKSDDGDPLLSVWRPSQLAVSTWTKVLRKISFGDCLVASHDKPQRDTYFVLSVTDSHTGGIFGDKAGHDLTRFINNYLPEPVKFDKVGQITVGRRTLYIWAPRLAVTHHKDFVALGHVVTLTETPPAAGENSIRCVPREWTESPSCTSVVFQGGGANCTLQTSDQPGTFMATSGRTADDGSVEQTLLKLRETRFKTDMPR
jgi:hypothetical protein